MKYLFLFCFFISTLSFTQKNSKLERLDKINWNTPVRNLKINSWQKKIIIPTTLILTGISLNSNSTKMKIQNYIREPFNGYKTTLDDYIQYAPIATMYGADLLKIPARNSIWNQTKYLIMSELVTAGIVHLLKNTTKIARPESTTLTSFPSGHTGQAFVASQLLFNEYYRTRPILGLSGFAFSGATGALRVINNRHWVPDVLVGAGIAILVTNLVYYFEPLKNWNPFEKNKTNSTIKLFPASNNNTYGLLMKIVF